MIPSDYSLKIDPENRVKVTDEELDRLERNIADQVFKAIDGKVIVPWTDDEMPHLRPVYLAMLGLDANR